MRQHRPDFLLIFLPVLLMTVGLVMIYTIGPAWAEYQNAMLGTKVGTYGFFIRQLLAVILSIAAMVVTWLMLSRNEKLMPWLLENSLRIVGLGLLLCFLVGGLGRLGVELGGFISCSGGACRAFSLPLIGSFQPAKFLKLGVILYTIHITVKRKQEGKLGWNKEFLVPMLSILAAVAVIVGFLEKDLGSTAVIVLMMICTVFAAGIEMKAWHYLGVIAVGIILGVLLIVSSPHRMERIGSFVSQTEGKTNIDDSHGDNALLAIGSGGLFGVGVGNSVQATGYLPESINDSIFAVMGETLGFVGLLMLLFAFWLLLTKMLDLSGLARNENEKLIPIAVFAWIAGHTIINIVGMTGIAPMKGITLPFISYGGSSMIFLAIAVGMTIYVSTYTQRTENQRLYIGRRQTTYVRRKRHE